MAQSRYLPYGQERWTSGPAQTDFTYTGQRSERGFGLSDYAARYYDPYLNRFISPDTMVPQPGNPQAFNRYSYANANPVKYVDPTGHFSEEEIEKGFEVKTWEDVLSLFEKGGKLEGKWGWLETLRRAENGDAVWAGSDRLGNFWQLGALGHTAVMIEYWGVNEELKALGKGAYSDQMCRGTWYEGLLDDYVTSKVIKADEYKIAGWRLLISNRYSFKTPATQKYAQQRYDFWGRVDPISVDLDLLGICTAGLSKDFEAAARVGYGAGTVGIVRNLAVSSPPDGVGAFLSGLGMAPGYVGMGASAASLINDLRKGIHYGP